MSMLAKSLLICCLIGVTAPSFAANKIFFSGVINASSINRLIKKIDKAVLKESEIIISLSSPGGNVNEAIRGVSYIQMLNAKLPFKIHTKVSSYSTCESACTILFTAGSKRFASHNSQFGFHSPKFQSGSLNGLTRVEIEDLYRKIWLKYISTVDKELASSLEYAGYLLTEQMHYISGSELTTGYVSELI
jgi:hypothetical protein